MGFLFSKKWSGGHIEDHSKIILSVDEIHYETTVEDDLNYASGEHSIMVVTRGGTKISLYFVYRKNGTVEMLSWPTKSEGSKVFKLSGSRAKIVSIAGTNVSCKYFLKK